MTVIENGQLTGITQAESVLSNSIRISFYAEQNDTALSFLSEEEIARHAECEAECETLEEELLSLFKSTSDTDSGAEASPFIETIVDKAGNIVPLEEYEQQLLNELGQYSEEVGKLVLKAQDLYIEAMTEAPEYLYSEAERLMALLTFEGLKNEFDYAVILAHNMAKQTEPENFSQLYPSWVYDYKSIEYLRHKAMMTIMLPLRALWKLYPKQYKRTIYKAGIYFEEPEYIGEGEEPELGVKIRNLYNSKTEELYYKAKDYEPNLSIFHRNATEQQLYTEEKALLELTIANSILPSYAPLLSDYSPLFLSKLLNAGGEPTKNKKNRSEKLSSYFNEKQNTMIYSRENRGHRLDIGIIDPETFWKNSKGTKKNLQFVLQKMAQQNYPEDIIIDLKEMVSLKMYSNTDNASRGLEDMYNQMRRVDIKELFNVRSDTPGKKKKAMSGGQLFYHRSRNGDIFTITANTLFPIELYASSYYYLPLWAYSLNTNAFDIAHYIFYLARQNSQQLAEKGKFNISLEQLHNQLQLPLPETCKHPGQLIKKPILDGIAEITKAEAESKENPQTAINGTMEIVLHAPDTKNPREWLTGFIEIKLTGEYITSYKKLAGNKQRQIEAYKTKLSEERAKQTARATLSGGKRRGRPPKKQ